jgi:hypothetical protein
MKKEREKIGVKRNGSELYLESGRMNCGFWKRKNRINAGRVQAETDIWKGRTFIRYV